ncbi:PREDICTED: protein NDUFAF4 homolog [Ceratosolen solmsi marchali]|uniref:Protein NDUFAF4 homolog n=1 Tax=Ceratosolen solmsi marchali TaxID=326594 RepID=A0AAJ6YKZ3_9HYME|nr:PREDICTED: protein NDUFAF4 homolog [Ceratosolen solmsi marchali]
MGNVSRRLSRPFKNYNIENRAHREIAKDKPKVAPSYKMKQTQINLVNELEPDYKVTSQTKNIELDNNLKKIYVKSYDNSVPDNNRSEDPERNLPKERLRPELSEFGFYESQEVVKGKISLRQAIQMIDKHSKDPIIYNSEYLAKEYYLEKKLVDYKLHIKL